MTGSSSKQKDDEKEKEKEKDKKKDKEAVAEAEAEALLCEEEYNLKTNTNSNCDGQQNVKRRPRKSMFDLRRISKAAAAAGIAGGERNNNKQGRLYCAKQGAKTGGLRVDEMLYGMKMAHLSCTDDSDERLVGSSPNAIAALEKAVGGDDPVTTAKLPLSQILKERFDLNLDCWIDESGLRKGRPVDTQGFIASNEDTIVLSYRFTTSIFDWLANLSMSSSEWEPDVNEALGHAGDCSCCKGWWTKYCTPEKAKPRVHTAYYNNFIYVSTILNCIVLYCIVLYCIILNCIVLYIIPYHIISYLL